MDITVFYSWQSDLPNSTNRSFIGTALEKASKVIRSDESMTIEPVVDRDTLNVPGSPNIASIILDKIKSSEIFVCDVSIINPDRSSECRPTPNPNVLIELGYAIKVLGNERIIMILNKAYGTPNQLPFDLRMNRVLTYEISESHPDKAQERNKLQRSLEEAIRLIIEENNFTSTITQINSVNLAERLTEYNLNDVSSVDFAGNLTDGLITLGKRDSFNFKTVPASSSTVFLAIPATKIDIDSSTFFVKAQEMFNVTRWDSPEQDNLGSRFFSYKVLPINRAIHRIEQDAIVIEEKTPNEPEFFSILRITPRGEISFSSSYFSTFYESKEVMVFRLGGMIHLLWAFLCMVKELQESLNYEGAFHVNVALTNTQETYLGHFADGRPDVLKGVYIQGLQRLDQICHRPNVLVTRENMDLSSLEFKVFPDTLRDIAQEIARAFNYGEAYCFDNDGRLPDNLCTI